MSEEGIKSARVAIATIELLARHDELGINAVSAPIRDHRGALAAMVSAMDSIQFIPAVAPERLVGALCGSGRDRPLDRHLRRTP